MANGFGELAGRHPQNSSCSESSSNNDSGNFECNICFELAQDPIVTLCGHLFCWPCLYKWLRLHAHSPNCPICKAVIQEDKLIPLYGRGKTSTDPRSKSVPGVDIPHRPTGMRPDTTPPQNPNHFSQHGFGFVGGFPPMAATRVGNFSLPANFGGFFPSLFNIHLQGFPAPAAYGAPTNFPFVFGNSFHGGHGHVIPPRAPIIPQENSLLTMLFLFVGAFIVFALLFT